MQEQLLDVLRALSSPNLDIRRKTLDIALDLITSRNIDEVRPLVQTETPNVSRYLCFLVFCDEQLAGLTSVCLDVSVQQLASCHAQ